MSFSYTAVGRKGAVLCSISVWNVALHCLYCRCSSVDLCVLTTSVFHSELPSFPGWAAQGKAAGDRVPVHHSGQKKGKHNRKMKKFTVCRMNKRGCGRRRLLVITMRQSPAVKSKNWFKQEGKTDLLQGEVNGSRYQGPLIVAVQSTLHSSSTRTDAGTLASHSCSWGPRIASFKSVRSTSVQSLYHRIM